MQQSFLKVLESKIIALQEEVGHAALKVAVPIVNLCNGSTVQEHVRDSQILVQICCFPEVLYSVLVLPECCINESHIRQDLGRVGNLLRPVLVREPIV
jgi:hypothetical protein